MIPRVPDAFIAVAELIVARLANVEYRLDTVSPPVDEALLKYS